MVNKLLLVQRIDFFFLEFFAIGMDITIDTFPEQHGGLKARLLFVYFQVLQVNGFELLKLPLLGSADTVAGLCWLV